LQSSLGLRVEVPALAATDYSQQHALHTTLMCAIHALGLTTDPSVDQDACAQLGLPTWSAGRPLGGLSIFISQSQAQAQTLAAAGPHLSEQLAQGGLSASSAPHIASLAYAFAHAFKTTASDGPCKQLAPAVLPSKVAPHVPLLVCVASSMSAASSMLQGSDVALRVVRIVDPASIDSAALQAAHIQRPADVIVGVQAASVDEAVAALVGDTPAAEVHAAARSAARRSLSIPVSAGAPQLRESNDTGNCTRPWTTPEIDDYQVYVWVIVLLVFMVSGAFICLACTIAGDKDPVLYSAFQASEFHAHAD